MIIMVYKFDFFSRTSVSESRLSDIANAHLTFEMLHLRGRITSLSEPMLHKYEIRNVMSVMHAILELHLYNCIN